MGVDFGFATPLSAGDVGSAIGAGGRVAAALGSRRSPRRYRSGEVAMMDEVQTRRLHEV